MELRLGTFNVWGLPEAFADDVSSRMRGIAGRSSDLDLDVLLDPGGLDRRSARHPCARRGLRRASRFAEASVQATRAAGLMAALTATDPLAADFERFRISEGIPSGSPRASSSVAKASRPSTLDG